MKRQRGCFFMKHRVNVPIVYSQNTHILERRPMPNVMVALQNIGGALCNTPKSLADAHYWSAVQ